MTDRIARAFYISGAIQAVVVDISKAFERAWHADLPRSVKSYRISVLTSV